MRESARLRRTRDVQRVRDAGARQDDTLFAVTALPTAGPHARLAISVPARLGTAVKRNRARRRARAAFAALLPTLRQPADLLVMVRPPVLDAPFGELLRSAESLLRAHGLLDPAPTRPPSQAAAAGSSTTTGRTRGSPGESRAEVSG